MSINSSDDEIDSFHREKDSRLLVLDDSTTSDLREKEVYGITSFNYDYDSSDEIQTASKGIAANNWGKTRKNFYGTSHASKTDRVADSEEEEVLELEGEEAIIRQKRLDLVTSNVNFNHFGLEAFDSCACVEEILRLKRSIENTRKVRSSLSDVDPTQEPLNKTVEATDASACRCEPSPNGRSTRRQLPYEIRKNKTLKLKKHKHKTNKRDKGHSRIKKREQFRKAIIRRRSQVPDVRKEISKYDGEKRGIRSTTIRSVKFK